MICQKYKNSKSIQNFWFWKKKKSTAISSSILFFPYSSSISPSHLSIRMNLCFDLTPSHLVWSITFHDLRFLHVPVKSRFVVLSSLHWGGRTMGAVARTVFPVCESLCCFCPALRARSRHPVKRYKQLLADIFPRSPVCPSNHFTSESTMSHFLIYDVMIPICLNYSIFLHELYA